MRDDLIVRWWAGLDEDARGAALDDAWDGGPPSEVTYVGLQAAGLAVHDDDPIPADVTMFVFDSTCSSQ